MTLNYFCCCDGRLISSSLKIYIVTASDKDLISYERWSIRASAYWFEYLLHYIPTRGKPVLWTIDRLEVASPWTMKKSLLFFWIELTLSKRICPLSIHVEGIMHCEAFVRILCHLWIVANGYKLHKLAKMLWKLFCLENQRWNLSRMFWKSVKNSNILIQ